MTTFYVSLADSLDWGVDRYSESASPFVNVQMPIVSYVNADASGANGYFVKLEFQHDTQVPDGEVEIYLTRHYRADQTGMSFFSSSPSVGSGAPTLSSLTTYWTLFRGTSYRFHNGGFERGSNGSITPVGSLNATDGFLVFSDVTGDTDLWFKDSVNGVDRYQILADVYRAQILTSTNISTYQQNRASSASTLVGEAAMTGSALVVDGVNWTSYSENGFYTVDRPGSVTGPTESSSLIQSIQSALLQKYDVYTTYDMSAVLSSQTHYFFNFTGNASGS